MLVYLTRRLLLLLPVFLAVSVVIFMIIHLVPGDPIDNMVQIGASPEQRAVIVLHHYLGLSLAESAEALAIPLGTMQSRLSRATQAMRAALDADERPAVGAVEVAR